MEEVCIVGMGYIGLPTAAMFATHGVRVKGVDLDAQVCSAINAGRIHIEEPNLEDLVKRSVQDGMLTVSTKVEKCGAFIICVPTPLTEERGADLSFVVSAAENISVVLEKGNLVVIESTVPPGCTDGTIVPILERTGLSAGVDFHVAHCPERVLPGRIVYELEHNNRIIGGVSSECARRAADLYAAFVKGDIAVTDATTAELCKLIENTYRDVNIALANELALLCEDLGVNAWDVVKYANRHPRVSLHQPGPGVGGHCLAVDPWFIVESKPSIARIIRLAREINGCMPSHVASRISGLVARGSKVAVLGYTYKADVDDTRESPIARLVQILQHDYDVEIVDPHVQRYNGSVYEVCRGADIVVLGVNHREFADVDFGLLSTVVRNKLLFDTRNFYDRKQVESYGFRYIVLGDGKHAWSRAEGDMVSEAALANE